MRWAWKERQGAIMERGIMRLSPTRRVYETDGAGFALWVDEDADGSLTLNDTATAVPITPEEESGAVREWRRIMDLPDRICSCGRAVLDDAWCWRCRRFGVTA